MDKYAISVILPNYNYANYLSQRIDSILNQTYPFEELIILDDASTDESREVIEKYKQRDQRIKAVYNSTNTGSPFRQWDKGIKEANGDIIWIAEADDYCESNLLEVLIKPFLDNNNVGISYCQSNVVDNTGQHKGQWHSKQNKKDTAFFTKSFLSDGSHFIKDHLIHNNVIPNASAVLFNKALYHIVGGVDFNIPKCADWYLWIKMLWSAQVSFHHNPLNHFRRHEKSVIATKESSEIFVSGFDPHMREKLKIWIKNQGINSKIVKDIVITNNYYINHDQGLTGNYLIKKRHFSSGIYKVVKASIKNRSLSYVKLAIGSITVKK